MSERFSATVMGRSAVLVTSTGLMICAVLQLFGIDVSTALDNAGQGELVDVAWSVLLVVAWVILIAATVADARPGCADVSLVFEHVGSMMLVVGTAVYAVAVLASTGFPGNLVVLSFCASTVINVAARQWLLHRRACAVLQEANGDLA